MRRLQTAREKVREAERLRALGYRALYVEGNRYSEDEEGVKSLRRRRKSFRLRTR